MNVHASLLPRWRGAAPIQWSILAGDAVTGVTTMQMAEGLDTGDMLLREETPIGSRETVGELHDRLAEIGARLAVRTLEAWPTPVVQDEAGVTYAAMLKKEMGRLDWARPAVELDRQVRGLSPWPGTFTSFRGEVLKVLRASPVAGEGEPGTLLAGGRVACGVGALQLEEVQLPGRRAGSVADFLNGSRVQVGERVGEPIPG